MSITNRVRRTHDFQSLIRGSATTSGLFVDRENNLKFTSNRQTPDTLLPITFNGVLFTPKVATIRVKASGVTENVETDTGYDLPPNAIVLDVFLNVLTAESTASIKTVEVGLLSTESGGDLDGFLDGVSLATAGIVRPGAVFHSGTDYPASTLRGVLLSDFTAGTATDDRGVYVEKPFLTKSVTAKSVDLKLANNAFSEAVFDIVIVFIELPNGVTT